MKKRTHIYHCPQTDLPGVSRIIEFDETTPVTAPPTTAPATTVPDPAPGANTAEPSLETPAFLTAGRRDLRVVLSASSTESGT